VQREHDLHLQLISTYRGHFLSAVKKGEDIDLSSDGRQRKWHARGHEGHHESRRALSDGAEQLVQNQHKDQVTDGTDGARDDCDFEEASVGLDIGEGRSRVAPQ
jgi:hypothetical protein